MINTLNESNLHKSLKLLYAAQHDGQMEQSVDNWICDVVAADGEIIEIQTNTLSALRKKAEDLLKKRRRLRIVAPMVAQKTIVTNDNGTIRKRKSPKKESLYSFLRNLTGMCSVLAEENCTLEIVAVHIVEERVALETPAQSKNRRRRFLRPWLKTGKSLESIQHTYVFNTRQDYISLLPQGLPDIFSASTVKETLLSQGTVISLDNARLLIWLLHKMNILTVCGKNGRTKLFTFK